MQSYNFFLNYLLRFPTARDFMFYVKLILIDFCIFFAKYKKYIDFFRKILYDVYVNKIRLINKI